MKKIKNILLAIICIFGFSGVVNADTAGPESVSYEAIITNKNGAEVYKYDHVKSGEVIPSGTKVRIYWEYEENGVIWTDFYVEGKEYDGGIILAKDITPIDDSYDIESAEIINIRFYVWDANKIELRKGPAHSFEKVNIELNDGDILASSVSYDEWAKVSIGNDEYWLYYYGDLDSGVTAIIDNSIMTLGEAKVYNFDVKKEFPTDEKNITEIGTIPDKVKLTSTYYTYGYWYVSYNGISGWIEDSSIFNKDTNKYITTEDVIIYKDKDFKEKTGKVIPANKKIMDTYIAYNNNNSNLKDSLNRKVFKITYLKYDGVEGYIDNESLASSNVTIYTVNNPNGVKVYNSPKMERVIGNLSYDDSFESLYSYYCDYDYCGNDNYMVYVNLENANGWVNYDDLDSTMPEIVETPMEQDDFINYDYEIEPTYEEEPIKINEKSLSAVDYILLCVAGAVVIGLTVFFTIKIVNKKNKKKELKNNSETQAENKADNEVTPDEASKEQENTEQNNM